MTLADTNASVLEKALDTAVVYLGATVEMVSDGEDCVQVWFELEENGTGTKLGLMESRCKVEVYGVVGVRLGWFNVGLFKDCSCTSLGFGFVRGCRCSWAAVAEEVVAETSEGEKFDYQAMVSSPWSEIEVGSGSRFSMKMVRLEKCFEEEGGVIQALNSAAEKYLAEIDELRFQLIATQATTDASAASAQLQSFALLKELDKKNHCLKDACWRFLRQD
ncbi:hypothetical protein Drorol1_Dr00019966 [Drosera rotundifolia]